MRRGLPLVLMVVLLGVLACGGPPKPRYTWLEPVTADAPLPEKVALLVDAVFMRRAPDGRAYASIEDSIATAGAVTDEAGQDLVARRWTATVKNKHFVAAYRTDEMLIANGAGGELYTKTAPLHLDPSLCRSPKTTADMTDLWRAAQQSFGAAPKNLPAELTRAFGVRNQVDTLVFVIVLSQKNETPSARPAAGPAADAIAGRATPFAAVLVVRAIDGAVVFRAVADIAYPQREGTIRDAVTAAFAGIPRRGAQPAYPTPAAPKTADAEPAAAAPASPWVQSPPAQADSLAGRTGQVRGYRSVSVMRTPSALGVVVATVPAGTAVRVIERDDAWFRVQLANGVIGWIPADLVEFK